jgi:hypothetical protein
MLPYPLSFLYLIKDFFINKHFKISYHKILMISPQKVLTIIKSHTPRKISFNPF